MDQPQQPFTVKRFLPLIILLLVLGWGGLFILMNTTQPTLWPRWLFFFLVVVGFTGIGLPFSVYLNSRFPSNPPAEPKVMVRQALWLGVYAAMLIWMNFGQVVNPGLATIFLVGFIVIEVALRLRERSLWRRP